MLRIRKGKNAIEELRVSSFLVQTVPKIVHQISENQRIKIEGENTSRAPTIPNLNEMVKMRGKITFYVTIHVIQVRCWFLTHFSSKYLHF